MGWIDRIAGLGGIDAALRARLERESRLLTVPAGQVIFAPGETADNLLIVLRGAVRVQHVSEGGRQIVLYRVLSGQTCIMTTACLMGHDAYSAEGVTETQVEAVMIPRPVFDALLAVSAPFRALVFDAYAQRITDLFLLLDDVAFQRMDVRLAQKLLDLAAGTDTLAMTHQQLAAELGSAREVVSRLLQEFRRRGLVSAARGTIVLEDAAGLRALAEAE